MDVPGPKRGAFQPESVRPYVVAVLVSSVAIILQRTLSAHTEPAGSLFVLLGAVVASAAYGGFFPSLVSVASVAAAAPFALARGAAISSLTATEVTSLVLFVGLGLSIAAVCETLRRRHLRAERVVGEAFREHVARDAAPAPVIEAPREFTTQMKRALRASRTIAWELDLRTGLFTHEAAMEVFATAPIRSPLPLRSALRYVYPKDRHDVIMRARRAIAHREPFVQHFRILVRRDAAPIWMESHGEVLCDPAGHAECLCGAMVDITAHKQALDALAAADRRKDEFIATLAHELRNPLSAIGAAAYILKSTSVDATQMSACADMIRRQAAHLGRLVDDLLDISRVIRDRLEFRREPIDLASAVTAALESTDELIKARRHELQVTLPTQPVDVEADSVRLAQVFGNLLANAAKYTPEGGSIHVSLERDANWATVRIRDSGVGIAAEELPHVFEPFYQVDAALSRARGGLGIGLALVQRITQLHGGSVEVSSAGVGHGSEFVVRLPVLAERRSAEVSPSRVSGVGMDASRPLRILVADDNADVAEAMALGLRMCGHDVTVAHDGDEALHVADEFRPQVALLDLSMPRRSGDEVAREIRRRPWAAERGILLVALTGWNPADLVGRSDLSAFDSQIMKPAEIDVVNRLVVSAQAHARYRTTQ